MDETSLGVIEDANDMSVDMSTEETTKETDSIKKVDLDTPLEKEFSGVFLEKKEFVGKKQAFIIQDLQQGKYRKILKIKGEKLEGWIDISKTNLNFLIDNFGSRPSLWISKKIFITGENFETVDRKGKTLKGILLNFSS